MQTIFVIGFALIRTGTLTGSERKLISAGFVEDALACLDRRGIARADLLSRAGLSDWAGEAISNDQYGRLWLALAAMTGDEFFGEGARPMRPGSFKLMCQAVLHTRDLGHALRRAVAFLRIVLDDPAGSLVVVEGEARIVLDASDPPRSAFAYRTYWLVLMGVACWLIGRRIPLRRLDFSCPPPPARQAYGQFFDAPVIFDCPQSQLVFDARHLSLPVIRDERALSVFLRSAPANILLRFRHDQQTTTRLRNWLRARPPAEWPGFDTLAARMHLSPATLRRRLRSEGQSFSEIRNDIRNAHAQHLLRTTTLSIGQIAHDLGYSEPSAFHRAFVKGNGCAPGAYRTGTGSARR